MSNAKRFLSVILAMIMMCSTLVIGANAAYTAYKDSGITRSEYNSLDKPVLTTDQYASAAMDEVDRMLNKEQLKFTRADIKVGEVDLTSIDAAMDSIYALVNGRLWSTFSSMLGDLSNLNVSAFKPEASGGVRRTTSGKTDTDIIYAVIQFLYDNKDLIVSYVNGTINLGTILTSAVDISKYTNVNKLLKTSLYKSTYETDVPSTTDVTTITVDKMVQDLIDKSVLKNVPELQGYTDISTGSMYTFIDNALKILYNKYIVALLNDNVKYEINKFCGVVYTKDAEGNITNRDTSKVNSYATLINIDYTVPQYTFTSGTFINNINNIIKSISDVMIKSSVFVWTAGDDSNLLTNVTNLAKAILCNTGSDFFASYIKVATPAEVNAMSTEQLVVYALRAIINGSVDGMYIPESATTIREFGYYALSQLLATAVPDLDFSSFNKNSTDTLVIMGIDYAIYSINSAIDMGLTYVTTMDGVDQQITKAINYGIDNYGGILNGITFNSSATGWTNLNTLVFSIIKQNWLPTVANGDVKTLIITDVIDNILNLNFDAIVSMLQYRSDSELQSTPKQVIINLATRIVNIIFPGAIASATTLDALATNSALGSTVNAVFNDLYTYKTKLVKSILPTLCDVLDLTSPQNFKFPDITCDSLISDSSGSPDYSIKIRNSSTGINTGHTDVNGNFTQDSLYTYSIQSVTSNVPTISLTNPGTIAGGKEATIRVTGSFPSDTVFIVTITYNVLTEDGTALTSSPITQYIYSYLSTSTNDSETKFTASNGNFSITDGPLNLYASSMSDLYKMQLTVENASTTQYTDLVPTTTALTKLLTSAYSAVDEKGNAVNDANGNQITVADGLCYLQLKEGTNTLLPKVDTSNGISKIYVLQTTTAYGDLTSDQKTAVWNSMIAKGTTTRSLCKYTVTTGATVGGVSLSNTKNVICLYNDYGLGDLLQTEMNKHRQASGYSSTTAWDAYTAAMQQAAKAVYSPFKAASFASTSASTGKAVLYKPAYDALTAAIEALDATATSQGVSSTQAIIDQYNPDNGETDYTSSSYVYFGVSDYKAYTYYNYRTEYKAAEKMINAATVPDTTTGKVQTIDDLTLAYRNHRLSLYGSRLVPVVANKLHLAYEITNAVPMTDQAKYSTESWANYLKAYNFAVSVNGEAVGTATSPTLKQSKVNTAYSELLEAEKRLVAPTTTEPTFTIVNPVSTSGVAPTVIETTSGKVITGIYGGNTYEGTKYFNCTGCYAEATLTSSDVLGTTSVITIKNSTTNAVIATYTVAVFGDVTGDATTDIGDLSSIKLAAAGALTYDSATAVAGDLNLDDQFDLTDVALVKNVASGAGTIDCVNRTIS
jgi:hypothetical protein